MLTFGMGKGYAYEVWVRPLFSSAAGFLESLCHSGRELVWVNSGIPWFTLKKKRDEKYNLLMYVLASIPHFATVLDTFLKKKCLVMKIVKNTYKKPFYFMIKM
jgi:hypothetical protein